MTTGKSRLATDFTMHRAFFLPIMVVTLPLPPVFLKQLSSQLVETLQWLAFWIFAILLIVPWLLCLYQLITQSLSRGTFTKHLLDEGHAPKIVVIIPCYMEVPELLLRTLDSLVDCDYPPACLHIFLSFDGDREDALFLMTLEKLGVQMRRTSHLPSSIDVPYRNIRITVSRFRHGGKRHCQKKTFKLVNRLYENYAIAKDDLFVLFIDSDCILGKACLQNFMYEMVRGFPEQPLQFSVYRMRC